MQFYRYADTDIYCGNTSADSIRYDKFNLLSLTMLPLLVNRLDNGNFGEPGYTLPRYYPGSKILNEHPWKPSCAGKKARHSPLSGSD